MSRETQRVHYIIMIYNGLLTDNENIRKVYFIGCCTILFLMAYIIHKKETNASLYRYLICFADLCCAMCVVVHEGKTDKIS